MSRYQRIGKVSSPSKWIGFRCQGGCGRLIDHGDRIAVLEDPQQMAERRHWLVWHVECTPEVVDDEVRKILARYRKVGVFEYERV